MNNQKKIELVNDGQVVDKNLVYSWDIFNYCTQYNGNFTISFVGVIIKNRKILFSFPKHYQVKKEDKNQISSMKQILYILSKARTSYGSFDKGIKGEFPIKAYLGILKYYKKYGLYSLNERYFENGYDGNIDWNKTINKSNKIIYKKNIMFFPFEIKKSKNKSVFISECMNYILADGSKYRDFITMIIPYKYINKNNIFNNLKYVLNELKKIRNLYFKDIEKKLINNLIEYIEWKSKVQNNVRLLTLKFENYWEIMINEYLNAKFYGIKDDKITWEPINQINQYKFCKPEMEYVESKEVRSRNPNSHLYKIQYDHIFIDNKNYKIVIFDSKYFYNEVGKLNYKQLFYHYNLMYKYPKYSIYNGLLLPTEKDYYTKIHVDRSDLDGVKIIEHYINLNLVLDYYLKII